jgi:ribonuclease kappa
MGHTSDPEDGHAAARLCYVAAVVYLGFIAVCGCQVSSTTCLAPTTRV